MVYTPDGILELGAAVLESDTWRYTATVAIPPGK
jgi:hypothetical protein